MTDEAVQDHVFKTDTLGRYEEVWLCEPPAKGIAYEVLREEWTDDYTVRTIREVKVLSGR
jgi:hypothetical protein